MSTVLRKMPSSKRRPATTTPELIDALVADLTPVRPLRPPLVRAACWLFLAAVVLGLVTAAQGVRSDLAQRLADSDFLARMAGAVLTGILAAIAAFMLSLPDRSRLWLLVPMPALMLWVASIGYQCLTNWVSVAPGNIRLGETARCFATLVLTSLPLSLVMLMMLRYATALRPSTVSPSGGLAVAGIAATALSLSHTLDASAMILIWNLGTATLFAGLASAFGRKMFSWVALCSVPCAD